MKASHLTMLLVGALGALIFYAGCKKNEQSFEIDTLNLPSTSFDYTKDMAWQSPFNPTTNDGATLGRVLFYDKNLSLNNTISCASCHKQENSFADIGATSEGFKGGRTSRNSLSIVNLADDSRLFWDMRTNSLEELVLQPISNHIEMGLDNTENLLKKLNRTTYYPNLFEKAFGSKEISEERISKAIAQFLRAIVSKNSKFDAFRNGNWGVLTQNETDGWNLFFNKLHCSGCHNGNDLNNGSGANIGLEMNYKDNGIGSRTGETVFNGVFKVPTLRNIALTAPYMHDGRFKTLEDVIEHYNTGVQNHSNLSFFLRGFLWQGNGGNSIITSPGCWNCGVGRGGTDFKTLNLSQTEKDNLMAFFKVLTDETFVKEEKYSNPFTK